MSVPLVTLTHNVKETDLADNETDTVRRESEAIALARVLCIGGVVYVHAWTGLDGDSLEAARGTWQENMRWVLMEIFGRSAVPLLGIISGYLVAGSRRVTDWRLHVTRKARTILLPMVLWNALALLFVCGAAILLGLAAPTPRSLGWTLQELLIVTHPPDINVQMPFLRDLFLCMVIAPFLTRLPTQALAALACVAGIGHVLELGAPVILRISILMFFILGILARRHSFARQIEGLPLRVVALPFLMLIAMKVSLEVVPSLAPEVLRMNHLMAALDLLLRISAAAFFWKLAWKLAGWEGRGFLLRLEPYAFFYFAAHLIVIWLGGPLLGKLTGKLGAPLYPLGLIAQPFLVLGVVLASANLLLRFAPAAAEVLSGGRLHRPRPAARPAVEKAMAMPPIDLQRTGKKLH